MDNLNNYAELYASIWKTAVMDDYNVCKKKLFFDITENLYPDVLKHDKWRRDTFYKITAIYPDKNEEIRQLEQLFKNAEAQLLNAVKRKIYREQEQWPGGIIGKDRIFINKYLSLKQQIIKGVQEGAGYKATAI